MPRIPFPDPASLPDDLRQRLGANPPNVTRMLGAASPAVQRGFSAFTRALFDESALSPQIREIAILRVGYLSNSAYELFQHEAYGRFVGLTDADLAAIKAGGDKAAALGEEAAAVIAFTDDVVKNVRPSDASLQRLRKHFSDRSVVDLTLVIGTYMMVSRFLETTGIEIDETPIDWKSFEQRPRD